MGEDSNFDGISKKETLSNKGAYYDTCQSGLIRKIAIPYKIKEYPMTIALEVWKDCPAPINVLC